MPVEVLVEVQVQVVSGRDGWPWAARRSSCPPTSWCRTTCCTAFAPVRRAPAGR